MDSDSLKIAQQVKKHILGCSYILIEQDMENETQSEFLCPIQLA